MDTDDYAAIDDQNLFSCAICGLSEADSSNLTTQNTLQTNATVGCGHQLCVYHHLLFRGAMHIRPLHIFANLRLLFTSSSSLHLFAPISHE